MKWTAGKTVPYGDLSIPPRASILNYGQGLFEGMKAQRTEVTRLFEHPRAAFERQHIHTRKPLNPKPQSPIPKRCAGRAHCDFQARKKREACPVRLRAADDASLPRCALHTHEPIHEL